LGSDRRGLSENSTSTAFGSTRVRRKIDQQNPPALSNQDWIVSQGYIDAQGNRSTDLRESCTRDETLTQCLQANGVRANYLSYQPGNRFWTFQWIETGIYVGFSVLALFATVWLVRRLN
jgi:hypothetical protein